MLNEKTVYELKTICMMYDISYPKNGKKADIVKSIEDAGITLEQFEKEFGVKEEYTEAVIEEKPEVVLDKKENVATQVQEKILLKMIHPRGAYNVGNGIVFTINEPFKALPKEQALEILRRAKNEVREATPEEVAYFYGVSV